MQTEILPNLELSDGFRTPEDGPAPYVTWEMENSYNFRRCSIYTEHFTSLMAATVQKYTWRNTQEALMDQIRAALEQELYPIYVSDGDSTAKRAQIRHSDYLVRGHKSLSGFAGRSMYTGTRWTQAMTTSSGSLKRTSANSYASGCTATPSHRTICGFVAGRTKSCRGGHPRGPCRYRTLTLPPPMSGGVKCPHAS